MKLSYEWLREWVTVKLAPRALAERLTLAGVEVGAIEPAGPALEGVVVGRVRRVDAHPQAPNLKLCEVEAGGGKRVRVVCGAPNVAVGIKAPLALPGTQLPDGRKIETAVIHGVESAGMLCSSAELGLDGDAGELLILDGSVRTGLPLAKALDLDDVTLELDLTPNRGDCLSVAGVAREVSALTGAALHAPPIRPARVRTQRRVAVRIEARAACPRYAGRVIEGLDRGARTPPWMRERLRRAGVRSLHPVVDVTNYVMLELGQPMHAFDLAKLRGGIRVRTAAENEALTLLDGRRVPLPRGALLIADDRGPIALAGVMGGEETAVSEETDAVFLESAHFEPMTVARYARAMGIQTDASQRFERGVDPTLPVRALERATALLLEIAGGRAGPIAVAGAAPRERAPIVLRAERLAQLLGMAVEPGRVADILKRLGMKVQRHKQGWRVVPPPYRFDIGIEVDLIEEVARVLGYDRIPVTLPAAPARAPELPESRQSVARLRAMLVDRDYQEVITYSFVDPELQQLLDPGSPPERLSNPISADMAVMRTTLWAGLLQALRYNRNRQQNRIRIFEIGRRFVTQPAAREEGMLAGAVAGAAVPEQWGLPRREVDFYDVKSDVEAVLALTGRSGDVRFVPAVHPALHPGQSAAIHLGGEGVGWIGTLHPALQARLDIGKVVLFELRLDALLERRIPAFVEISRYPAVRRDLAVVVPETTEAQTVLDAVRRAAGPLLTNLQLFDVYRGEGIDSGRKSLALGLTFQDSSRTLRESEVDALEAQVIEALQASLGAQLRR